MKEPAKKLVVGLMYIPWQSICFMYFKFQYPSRYTLVVQENQCWSVIEKAPGYQPGYWHFLKPSSSNPLVGYCICQIFITYPDDWNLIQVD
jgi:hypothetical protein